jgi:hypothetical protein
MTARSTRLITCLVALFVLSFGVSLALSGAAMAANGVPASAKLCVADAGLAEHRALTCSNQRIAQLPHCSCCGTDENGHCNHQCCN